MNQRLESIKKWWVEGGIPEEVVDQMCQDPIQLAYLISQYAHRDQKRENGEEYFYHPERCQKKFIRLLGMDKYDNYYALSFLDEELLADSGLPYRGVQEVCYLHDVVEDTDFTLEELQSIYEECDMEVYFLKYIKDPLQRITHEKGMAYEDYVRICGGHPTSALVKMLDLQDNLTVLDLIRFDEHEYDRSANYLYFLYIINQAYHFLEGFEAYRQEMRKWEKETKERLKEKEADAHQQPIVSDGIWPKSSWYKTTKK